MKREEVTAIFPDATDEQITNILNAYNKDVASQKAMVAQYKADANRVTELQKELDDLKKQNMTAEELAETEKNDLIEQNKKLEATIKGYEYKSKLLEGGISSEKADEIINSLNSGNFDVSLITGLVADAKTSGASEMEKQLLNGTAKPNGAKPEANVPEESDAEKIVKNLFANKSNTNTEDILNGYLMH